MSTTCDPQILLLAEVLLGREAKEFTKLLDEYMESDYFDFLVRYPHFSNSQATDEKSLKIHAGYHVKNSLEFLFTYAEHRKKLFEFYFDEPDTEPVMQNISERLADLRDTQFDCDLTKLQDENVSDSLQCKSPLAQFFVFIERELQRQGMTLLLVALVGNKTRSENDIYDYEDFRYTVVDLEIAKKVVGVTVSAGPGESRFLIRIGSDYFKEYDLTHQRAIAQAKKEREFNRWMNGRKLHRKLKTLAKVVLGNEFNDFQSMFSDKVKLTPQQFVEKYEGWIQSIFNPPDREQIDGGEISAWYFTDYRPGFDGTYEADCEQFFLDFAQQQGRFAWVDWSGEVTPGEVANVVNRILQRHWNTTFEWDTAAFDGTIAFDALERGEYIVLLFKAIDAKLQRQGFRVVHFQTGSDVDHYSVLPVEKANKIIGLRWGLCFCVYSPDKIPTTIPYFSLFFHSLRETFWRSIFPIYRLLKKFWFRG